MQPGKYLLDILYPLVLQSVRIWFLSTNWYYKQHKDKW